ncbi:MAG: polysaccharide biosynthesis/export family protein [Planctomycetota bacterium]|jgi:protein involved in polysaccharide export with SLBB domain
MRTISFRDKPYGITEALDPTPEDLIPTNELYKIGPSDIVNIRILDFLAQGLESNFEPTVDELGRISIPQLPVIHVNGMTAQELEAKIKKLAIESKIFPEDENKDPIVNVSVIDQRQRMYNIEGTIARPAAYRILRSDFRLKEAVNLAGGLETIVKTIYVFRRGKKEELSMDKTNQIKHDPRKGIDLKTPPVVPNLMNEMVGSPPSPSASKPRPNPKPTTRQNKNGQLVLPPEKVEKDLIEAITSTTSSPAATNQQKVDNNQPTTAPDTPPSLPPFIFVDDRFIEAKKDTGPETDAPELIPPPKQEIPSKPVDWEELVGENGRQRIIKIPAQKLRQCDSNYNIVIRSGDWILLETGPTGFYYVMGHVSRPGFSRQFQYEFGGEEIALSQAIASVGGLAPTAWPTRCEIRRTLDGDRYEITQWNLERIMAGLDPDIYLKPGDVVNVGTHAIVPLLIAVRNGLTASYGVSFVYSRNFADIDSFASQANPDNRRRVAEQQIFPGLFP